LEERKLDVRPLLTPDAHWPMCLFSEDIHTTFRGQCLQMLCIALIATASSQVIAQAQEKGTSMNHPTFYRTIRIDGPSIFYREAGPKDAPTIFLLHGVPSSSRMLEPRFAGSDRYHLVAPDYPGFGHSDWPDPKKFA